MKSIEERASDFADSKISGKVGKQCTAIGYIHGAKDLLKDACEWWESRCDYLGISKYQIELFKKAMEEGEQ